jgi:ubiquinone/menaquinone biosynthesis C-methylase UbiE
VSDTGREYLLAGEAAELERLRLQARVWEPEAEAMLDRIGVTPGARCIDLGCGAMGILGPLSRRVGPSGRVAGVDLDAKQLAGARAFVTEAGLSNVEILELDAYRTGLPARAFDLVHVRFVFAPVGRDDELLREMLRLVRPAGVVAVQEPDASSWTCLPPHPSWERLTGVIQAAFARAGGDFNAGRRLYTMLRTAGLQDVSVRAAVQALPGGHPYLRLPVQFATSLRGRILDAGLVSAPELDAAVADCERIAADPTACGLTFVLVQAWGRAPAA